MSEVYDLSWGEIFRELRIFNDFKQKKISDYLNITCQAYSNYENNKRTPDIETLCKIARFYHISLDQLVSFRYTRQLEDSRNYAAKHSLYRAVTDTGITIPLTAKQAKLVTDILSLSSEDLDACQKLLKVFIDKSKA